MDALRSEVKNDFARLIPQLVLFDAEARQRHDEDRAALKYAVVKEFEIQGSHVVAAVVRYLDNSNKQVDNQVRRWLRKTEHPCGHSTPDFTNYAALIAQSVRDKQPLPRNLIHYMFESHPGEAALTMTRGGIGYDPANTKPIVWAEHQVADVLWKWKWGFLPDREVPTEASEALAALAHHKQWWARLYVAEIMRQHPPFRTDDLIETLIVDPDETVRSTVFSFLGGTKSEPATAPNLE